MPIPKAEAQAAAAERDAGPFAEFCEKIDQAILRNVGTGHQITVDTTGVQRHIVARAIETYRAIGWTCADESDYRSSFIRLA